MGALSRLASRRPSALAAFRYYSLPSVRRISSSSTLTVLGKTYDTDDYTNVTPTIASKLSTRLYERPGHPLHTIRTLVEAHFPTFTALPAPPAVVTPATNFDSLSFPDDHPGRARSDSYYISRSHMLRTHTSAHEVESFAAGHDRWLLTADVYRRDEIDAAHYPVFHQLEGARLFDTSAPTLAALADENAELEARLAASHIAISDVPHHSPRTNPVQPGHDAHAAALVAHSLKLALNGLLLDLFGRAAGASADTPLRVRWIEAQFPFTTPSFEVEVFFRGAWLEVLGSGVVLQRTLERANVADKIGWAFGLGLDRLAMILYSIPDIRLLWTEDPRFHTQFSPGEVSTFVPYSRYPSATRDVSFWFVGDTHDNDVFDVVRDVGGDLAEDVRVIDRFSPRHSSRRSATFRITYRAMDRSLPGGEVSELHGRVRVALKHRLGVMLR